MDENCILSSFKVALKKIGFVWKEFATWNGSGTGFIRVFNSVT
jgi:hypothetical protein